MTAATDLFSRRWLQWDYFLMGLMGADYVSPQDLHRYRPPYPRIQMVQRVLGEVWYVGQFDDVVRVKYVGPAPVGPRPNLAERLDLPVATREWHGLGLELITWLCGARHALDSRLNTLPVDVAGAQPSPGEYDAAYDAITLPPVDDFLKAAEAVQALEPATLHEASGTVRHLARGHDEISAASPEADVWRQIGLTFADRACGVGVNLYRVAVMCHVIEAVHRDILYLAEGRTPTPFWDGDNGILYLHHRPVLELAAGKCGPTGKVLEEFELRNWPRSITLPPRVAYNNLPKLLRKYSKQMEETHGIKLSVVEKTDRETKQALDLTINWAPHP